MSYICLHSIISNWRLRFSLPSIILEDLLGNRTLLKWAQKVMVCDLWLVAHQSQIERIESVFRSGLCVSVFQGSLLVIVIIVEGSEKRNCEGGFWTLEFVCEKRSKNNKNELWKTVSFTSCQKPTTAICFNLLQVCPSVPQFVFTVLLKPSCNVFSDYFYVSLDLVAVPTFWILIKFMTQLL